MPALTPQIIKVTQRQQLDARGNLANVIAIVYTIGNHGPFTLITTAQDISSGEAAAAMNKFAATLNQLPGGIG